MLLVAGLTHPLVAVDGEGTCPAPDDVQRRLAQLIPEVDESERQDRAYLLRTPDALQVDLRRDDGQRIAERRLPATGSCDDLAAAAAVIIAAWEMRLKPEIAGGVKLPSSRRPPEPSAAAQARAPAAPSAQTPTTGARASFDLGGGVVGGVAGGEFAPGAKVVTTFAPAGWRLGFAAALSAQARRIEELANTERARWTRAVVGGGARYRFGAGHGAVVDAHLLGLVGRVAVEGTRSVATGAPPDGSVPRADSSVEVGASVGGRVARPWGAVAPWLGVDVTGWPGRQRVVGTAGDGQLPRVEAQLSLGVSWGRFP
jgi:hypothetical protein